MPAPSPVVLPMLPVPFVVFPMRVVVLVLILCFSLTTTVPIYLPHIPTTMRSFVSSTLTIGLVFPSPPTTEPLHYLVLTTSQRYHS